MRWYYATFSTANAVRVRVRKESTQTVVLIGGVRVRLDARLAKTLFDLGAPLDDAAQKQATEEEKTALALILVVDELATDRR